MDSYGAGAGRRQVNLERRRVVRGLGGVLAGSALWPAFASAVWSPRVARSSTLFTLGVASGDPRGNGVQLWTRLAPDPLNGGGMGTTPVSVRWEIATDPDITQLVQAGAVTATVDTAHSVRVPVRNLRPDSWYYYRFTAMGEHSRVGRTRTFPRPDATPERLRFALVCCQNYEQGYYAAYGDIAQQDLDFVLHVGDYIYESAADTAVPEERRHNGGELEVLEDYRNRYALYKLDPQLQDAHAAFPFLMVWDDHEVDNNYAGDYAEDDEAPKAFLDRRGHAYQAYREHQPLPPRQRLIGDSHFNLYRRAEYGRLARFQLMDTRQFRTDQPCNDVFPAFLDQCPELLDPEATMTGARQEQWVKDGLTNSPFTWNVLAQQVMFTKWDLGGALGVTGVFNPDAWDGYQGARARLLDFLANVRPQNTVVLSGDIHAAFASDIKANFDLPEADIVAHEFTATSISSYFGDSNADLVPFTLPDNPHIKYFEGYQRGYALCEVTPTLWRTDYRGVERVVDPVFTVPSPDLPSSTLASFGVHAGVAGIVPL
jgi:alkaline phosphatase D